MILSGIIRRARARRRTRALLRNALQQLPASAQAVYRLSAGFGLSNEDVARHLGLSPTEAERQLAMALTALEAAVRLSRR